MRKSLFSLCFLLCTSPLAVAYADGGQAAAPAPAAVPAPAAAPAASPGGNEVICKRLDATTGSRIGARRVCKTAAQWLHDQQVTYETMQNLQQYQQDQATMGQRPGE